MAAKLFAAGDQLKATLSLSEESFRFAAPQAHQSARDYFIFEALDEMQKASIAVLQLHELLEDEEESDPNAPMTRIAAESTADQVALWQRKLIEVLTDLIGFSDTPEDVYFRDCLLHAQLDQQLGTQNDLSRFYGAKSHNLAHQIEETVSTIENLEDAGLDAKKAWYRQRKAPVDLGTLVPGRILASFGKRLQHALPLADYAELAGLGFSYGQGFGNASANLHARPGGIDEVVDMPTLEASLKAVIAVALPVLHRCQNTLEVIPEGENRWFANLVADNEGPGQIHQSMLRGRAEAGDIVLAYGELAQVLEIAQGVTGYRSFRVRYLSQPPLPEVPEDWHIAQHVKVVLDRERTRQMVQTQAEKVPEKGAEKLLDLGDRELMNAIAESVAATEAAGVGLREAILREAKEGSQEDSSPT